MFYQITGKKIHTGEALNNHVKSSLDSVVTKYAQRPIDATVIFSKNADQYVCEAMMHLSTGLTAQSKTSAHEIYAAFDATSKKLGTQLRRYKRRLKDHSQVRSQPVELSETPSYRTELERLSDSDLKTGLPLTVAETDQDLDYLSVSQAVMQMELAGAPVLVFRNEGHNGVNVVYRRKDGNVGWVDPA
ncbi:MAG: ribosome-associated translation inhibitor RaiA [Planktomarina sp.]|nr:ribosome-associated translation inhibitor RaiA [Planktomarina sp.]